MAPESYYRLAVGSEDEFTVQDDLDILFSEIKDGEKFGFDTSEQKRELAELRASSGLEPNDPEDSPFWRDFVPNDGPAPAMD
ncbi:MAG: hypothetical protein ACQKBY_05235 [Verrucomicrobiales bacterium]